VVAVPAELRGRLARWETLTVALLAFTIVAGAMSSQDFLTGGNLNSMLSDITEVALISLPMTFIIVTGEIDLSVASILGLSSALLGSLWDHNWPIEGIIPFVLVVGGLAGAFNGVLVTRLGLPSLAVTIGTLTLYRGLAFVILGDKAVADLPTNYTDWAFGTFAGTQIPNPFMVFVVLAIVFGFVLHRTTLGRSLFAIGANEETAFFSGLRVKRIKLWLFVLSGVVSALAGVIYALRFGSARADNGTGLELSVVAVVLLGGVSIFGGKGNMLGVIVAVILLGAIRSALTINDVADEVLTIVTGGLLLLSVLGPSVAARVGELRARRRAAREPVPAGAPQ
jgi:rhamnose transport system permease protein